MKKAKKIALLSQPKEAVIEGLSHEGRGIARLNGKTTFIRGALPNETVSFSYTETRSTFDTGVTLAVRTPSPHRISPVCAHFGVCGGCSLQHLSPTEQIQFKQQAVSDLLKHQANVTPERWLPAITGPTEHYRRSARLGVRYVPQKNRVLVGFREISGRYLTDMTQCHTLDARIGNKIELLSQCLATFTIKEQIPQIEVACGDERCALIFRHLQLLTAEDVEKLKQFGKQHTIDIYTQAGGPQTLVKQYPENTPHHLSYSLPDVSCQFQFHPLDFIQINATINQQMVNTALQLLDLNTDDRVLDLFCGLGNFTLPMARIAHTVTGIEGEASMVARGKQNAELNQLNNVNFAAMNLFTPEASLFSEHFSKILLDPPRAGAIELMPWLAKSKAERIVYVSCHPATLARDIAYLTSHGYRLAACGLLDMFPHTTHVETIALLLRE